MSCCGGGSSAESKAIDKNLQNDKKKMSKEIKLLLLGAGESGKSTIAKQMKILHKEGFTEEECTSYRSIVYNNLVSSVRSLLRGAMDLGIPPADSERAGRVLDSQEDFFSGTISQEFVADIKELLKDENVQQALKRSHEFQLIDSASYYFDNLDRIAAENYIPSETDVLRSRAKTTGIIEIEFDVDKTHFRMVDVGGQRSERKKWMHCFQDVTAVIFCVALSEYNLRLQEDDSTNRMHESLKLFREICNSKWFLDTSMIIFFNKKDIFQEKIQEYDLNVCFPEYTGGKDYKNAVTFIQERFTSQNEHSSKMIYPHVTVATDTSNVRVVFNAVRDIILNNALTNAGMI